MRSKILVHLLPCVFATSLSLGQNEFHAWNDLQPPDLPAKYKQWVRWENLDEPEVATATSSAEGDVEWMVNPEVYRPQAGQTIRTSQSFASDVDGINRFGVSGYFYDIESRLPSGSVFPKQEVRFDTKEHKAGTSAMRWNWQPGAVINIPIPHSIRPEINRHFSFWVYNEHPHETFFTAYLHTDATNSAGGRIVTPHMKVHVWLDFAGWRRVNFFMRSPTVRKVAEDEQVDQQANSLRLVAPADAKQFVCIDRISEFTQQQTNQNYLDCFNSYDAAQARQKWGSQEEVRTRQGVIPVPEGLSVNPKVIPPKFRMVPGRFPILEDREMTADEVKGYQKLKQRFSVLPDDPTFSDDPAEIRKRNQSFEERFGWIFKWRDPDGKVRGPNLTRMLRNDFFDLQIHRNGTTIRRAEHYINHYSAIKKGDIIAPMISFGNPIIDAHNDAPCEKSLDAIRIFWQWVIYHGFNPGNEMLNNQWNLSSGQYELIGKSMPAIREIDRMDGTSMEDHLIDTSLYLADAFYFAANFDQNAPGAWRGHANKWLKYPHIITSLMQPDRKALSTLISINRYLDVYLEPNNCALLGHKPDYTAIHHGVYNSYWGIQDGEESLLIDYLRGTPWALSERAHNVSTRNMIQRARTQMANRGPAFGKGGSFHGQVPYSEFMPRLFVDEMLKERMIKPGIEEGNWLSYYLAGIARYENDQLPDHYQHRTKLNPAYIRAVAPIERYNIALHSHARMFHSFGRANLGINGRSKDFSATEPKASCRAESNQYSGTVHVTDRYLRINPGFYHLGFNWARFPGATAYDFSPLIPVEVTAEKHGIPSYIKEAKNCLTHTVSQHHNGVFGMIQKSEKGLSFRKSRFLFDETVVCLGSGITPETRINDIPIVTGILQANTSHGLNVTDPKRWLTNTNKLTCHIDRQELEFPVISQQLPLDQSHTIISPHGFAYFVPKQDSKAKLQVQWVKQKSCGVSTTTYNVTEDCYHTTISEADVMTAFFDHGEQVADGQYEFALVLGDGSHPTNQDFVQFVEQYKTTQPYQVTAHNNDRHSVYSDKTRQTGIVIFNEKSSDPNAAFVVQSNKPLGIMIKELAEESILLTASDGDLNNFAKHPDSKWGHDDSRVPPGAVGSPLREIKLELNGAYVLESAHPVDRAAGGARSWILPNGNTVICYLTRDGHNDAFRLKRVAAGEVQQSRTEGQTVVIHPNVGQKTKIYENAFQRDVILTFGTSTLKPPEENGGFALSGEITRFLSINGKSGEITRKGPFPKNGASISSTVSTPDGPRQVRFVFSAVNQAPVLTTAIPTEITLKTNAPGEIFHLNAHDPEGAEVDFILFNSTSVIEHFAIHDHALHLIKPIEKGNAYRLRIRVADQGDPHVSGVYEKNALPAYIDHQVVIKLAD